MKGRLEVPVAVVRSLVALLRRGGLLRFLRTLRDSAAMVRLSLFLALPALRGTRRLGITAWQVIGYRLWNDLDFEFLTWHSPAVTGLEHLRAGLADGRGVIACSHHLGAYRRAYYELVRRGFDVALVADDRVAGTLVESTRAQLRRQGVAAEEIARFEAGFSVLDATRPGMVQGVFDALDRNAIVLVYLDGNTGARLPGAGPATDSTVVELFGQKLAVRHGACRIAYLRKIPIVPLFARWQGGRPVLACLPPIVPDSSLPVAEFCRRTLRTLFELAEAEIRRHPAQFEHWMYLHRWRAGSREGAPGEEAVEAARRQILAGGEAVRYRVDRGRLLLARMGGRKVLADPACGRFFEVGRLLAEMVGALRRGLSLREIHLRLGRRYAGGQVLETLARIKALGLLAEEGEGCA